MTDVEKEKLKGRYTVIAAAIGAAGAIISAVIGFYAVVVPLREQNTELQKQNDALVEDSQETEGETSTMQNTITALQDRLSDLENRYAILESTNSELQAANSKLESDYQTAQSTIQELSRQLGGEEEEVSVSAPSNMQSEPLYSFLSTRDNFGEQIDNQGKSHENCIGIYSTYWQWASNDEYGHHYYGYFSIDLDWQYQRFTGILFQSEKYTASPIETKVTISGSAGEKSTILWTGKVNGDKKPASFDLDIYGLKSVTIRFDHANDEETNYAFLTDTYLWK